jgi:hypothetical protein
MRIARSPIIAHGGVPVPLASIGRYIRPLPWDLALQVATSWMPMPVVVVDVTFDPREETENSF